MKDSDWSHWTDDELVETMYWSLKILGAELPWRRSLDPYSFETVVNMITEELQRRRKADWAFDLIDEWDARRQ